MLVFWHDLRVSGDPQAIAVGGALVFGSAFAYALYLVGAGGVIARLGSMRFIAWAMLASTVFVLAQFALTRPLAALDVPPRIHAAVARDGGVLDGAADLARSPRRSGASARTPRR